MIKIKRKKHHIRTLWLSDIHLGTRDCKVNQLLELLDYFKCNTIYLVGDIIDMWQLRRTTKWWTQDHTEVIQKLISKAKKGTKITYIIGNHDEHLRRYLDSNPHVLGNISLADEDVYIRDDGRRMWIIHGDKYDMVVKYQKWISVLGSVSYTILLKLNTIINKVRTHHGYDDWSMSQAIRHKVKDAVNYLGRFENALQQECEAQNYDGVICGHVHQPVLLVDASSGKQYWNCGDFVHSCSAIIEELDGTMKIIQWKQSGDGEGYPSTLFESQPLPVEQN